MINNIINALIMGIPALSTFNANSVSTLNLVISLIALVVTVVMMVVIYKRRAKDASVLQAAVSYKI
jgi:hypothetical protein